MMYAYLEIDIRNIINNILKIGGVKCLVAKSNFYGMGYKALEFLSQYVEYIVVANYYEAIQIMQLSIEPEPKIIIMYDMFENDESVEENNLFWCIISKEQINKMNKLNKTRTFLRTNSFLELHGMEWETVKEKLSKYRGVFVHINENLNENEERELLLIDKYVSEAGKILNIGGSVAEKIVDKLSSAVEYRFAKKVIWDSDSDTCFSLHLQILNRKLNKGYSTKIGYKSDSRIVSNRQIYLLNIGYGDWSLLPRIYEKGIQIKCSGVVFEILCYPCMSTCWVACNKKIEQNNIVLFKSKNDVELICRKLEIDVDEFLCSFSMNIERRYKGKGE